MFCKLILPALLLAASGPIIVSGGTTGSTAAGVAASPTYERLVDSARDIMHGDAATVRAGVDDDETVLIWNPISFSTGSSCLGSTCIVSGCTNSACPGSACLISGCAGSGCVHSGCCWSGCIESGCAGSTCVKSTCIGSACPAECEREVEEGGVEEATGTTSGTTCTTAALVTGSWNERIG